MLRYFSLLSPAATSIVSVIEERVNRTFMVSQTSRLILAGIANSRTFDAELPAGGGVQSSMGPRFLSQPNLIIGLR